MVRRLLRCVGKHSSEKTERYRRPKSVKTVYTAHPAPGVVLGVTTTFITPYLNILSLTGVKRAPNPSRLSELMVYPDTGVGLRLVPTPSWVVAVGKDYEWAVTGKASLAPATHNIGSR